MKIIIQKSNNYLQKIFMIVVFLFMVTACGDDSSPTNNNDDNENISGNTTLSINGDGWTNNSFTASTSIATYATISQMVVISVTFEKNMQMLIYINGNKTGTYSFKEEDDSGQGNGVTLTNGTGETAKFYFWKDNSGSITISNFGAVGSRISGTYTGKLYNAASDAEVSISGNFSAVRTVDVPTNVLN